MFGTANVMNVILEVKNGDIYNPETLQKLDRITKYMINTKGVVPYQILSIAHPAVNSATVAQGAVQVRPIFYPGVPQDAGGRRARALRRVRQPEHSRRVTSPTTTPPRSSIPASGRRRSTSATSTTA